MASTYISRSISGSPTNPDKFTISFWVKRSKLGAEQTIIGQYASANFRGKLGFVGDDRLEYIQKNDGNTTANLITTRKFRDVFGFYNIVVQFDTSQGTASNRIKIYVNGVQETAFDASSYPAQNLDMRLNQASGTLCIGQDGNSSNYCDLILTHFHLVDGATEAPTVFGSTDSTTGEWKINTSPTISEYGDDGFFVLKDGNSVTDQSGKSNNFTVGAGTLTTTKDCPSNVFATFNPLDMGRDYSGTIDLKNGNTTQQNASDASLISTLGMKTGKWYAEFKIINAANTRSFAIIDMEDDQGYVAHSSLAAANSYAYRSDAGTLWNGQTQVASSVGDGNAGDIISMAIDLDSATKTIKWQKNGSDLSGTTSINITQSDITWGFFVRADGGQTISANFGNGYFGTTAVSSNSGNGYSGTGSLGIFQYQPPTGFTALCTKGLNL